MHPRGFGFVVPDGGGDDLFIPPGRLGDALSGDRVAVVVTEPDAERGPVGYVQEVLTPRAALFTGELCADEAGGWQIRPLQRELPTVIPVHEPRGRPVAGTPGQWVRARLLRARRPGEPLQAEVLSVAGTVGSLVQTLDAVAAEFDLVPPYSAEEQAAAADLRPLDLPREDLLDRVVVAIDPADAKDHDDALSVEPGPVRGTLRIGIHIADVAAYVTPDSAWDRAAARRGFTAYLPGRTLPMLPRALAGTLCSLVEGEARPAHTVFIDVSRRDGRILGARRCHTRVRVTQLLSYDDVQRFLDDGTAPGWPAAVRQAITDLAAVAEALRRRRTEEEQFLDLAAEEIRVRCSEHPPAIVGVVREAANAAHALVEEFMLAANSAVGCELRDRRIPGFYRVHPAPQRAEIEEFRVWAARTFNLRPRDLHSRAGLNRFLASLDRHRLRPLVVGEFLRALPRAGYTTEAALHFGLGKECYCHFTSPIRRYADLVVHQQLLAADVGQPLRPPGWCRTTAEQLSALEVRVDSAYFAANDRMKLHYLSERQAAEPGLVLPGIVSRATAEGGWLVYLPELAFMGTLSLGLAAADGRHRRRSAPSATGRFRPGDAVQVGIRRLDIVRGELQLRPAAATAAPASARSRGSRRGRGGAGRGRESD